MAIFKHFEALGATRANMVRHLTRASRLSTPLTLHPHMHVTQIATDLYGVVTPTRGDLAGNADNYLHAAANPSPDLKPGMTLADVLPDADVFVGVSAGNMMKPEMLMTMALDPVSPPQPHLRVLRVC